MKLGIILFILGLSLVVYLSKFKFKKIFFKNLGIAIGILLFLYGSVLMLQPSDDTYVVYTKTTVSK